MRIWLILEDVDGQLVKGAEIVYERGDSGPSDLHQLVAAYQSEGRSIHVLDLDVWMEQSEMTGRPGANFLADWWQKGDTGLEQGG